MTATPWSHRHVLSLEPFSLGDYNAILDTAAGFEEVLAGRTKKVAALQGQVVTHLFFEPSTRTRSSFELAAKRLSADVLNFSPGTSSLSKGETILDTAKTYLAMGTNLMVVRHRQTGVPHAIAAEMDRLGSGVRVLNAGDGQHEHPSQALLDLYSICAALGKAKAEAAPDAPAKPRPRAEWLRGKKVAIVGDILHSRVARSNLWSLTACGAEVHLAGPPTLLPRAFAEFVAIASPPESPPANPPDDPHPDAFPQERRAPEPCPTERGPVLVHWDLAPALAGADFVMALRLQQERMTDNLLPSLREYHQRYGLTRDRLRACNPGVKLLHPGPTNRGVEVTSDLMDDPALSLVGRQVANGVAIRMALLYLLGLGKSAK